MNKAKAMLDALMGPSRDVSAKNKTNDEFRERGSCKHYLVGCCPNAMLGKKMEAVRRDPATFCICPGVAFDRASVLDPEGCKKLHSLGLRTQLNEHPEAAKYRKQYEEDLRQFLKQIIDEAEKKVLHEKAKREVAGNIPENEKMCDVCGMRYKLKKKEFGIETQDHHAEWDVHKAYVKLREKLKELDEKAKEYEAEKGEDDKKDADKKKDEKKEAKSSDVGERSRSRERGGGERGGERSGRDRSERGNDRSRSRERGGGGGGRGDRRDRGERGDRGGDRGDRGDRGRGDRGDRGDRGGGDRRGQGDRDRGRDDNYRSDRRSDRSR